MIIEPGLCQDQTRQITAWPFLGGWLFDVTGSYQVAFAVAALAIAASAVAAWVAAPRRVRATRQLALNRREDLEGHH